MNQTTKELLRLAIKSAKKEGVSTEEILEEIVSVIKETNSELNGSNVKINSEIQETSSGTKETIILEEKDDNSEVGLEKQVTVILQEVGIPAHIKGYHYVRTAIILAVETPEVMGLVTKKVYPFVAEEHKTTPSKVERAIRHAIEVAWGRGNVEILDKYFSYTVSSYKGKPTNSEFIAMIADHIRMKKKQ